MEAWGIPFDHIENHWTDRQFLLMLRRMNERRTREREQVEDVQPSRSGKAATSKMKYSQWVKSRSNE